MDAYQALFDVTVEHSFYSNGVCSCLNFVPTEKTRRLFDNTGLVFRTTPNSIQIFYDKNNLEPLQLYAEDQQEALCFAFKVYSIDPEFRSYTEPFSEMAGKILYFDNRAAKTGVAKHNLSKSKYVSKTDFKKPDSNELKDIITQKDRLLPPVFVVKIFAASTQGSLLNQWLKATTTRYCIAFNVKQTFWKYYLLGKMAKQSSYIVDPENQVEFENLGETSLSDQRTALAFRSRQSIPLKEHYAFRFQLKEKAQRGENIIINRLPVACIAHTGKDVIEKKGVVVSEIYINS